ncbi:SRPBCC family protein [Brevibacillus fluminis]|uniref:SRPBCC family protein n=1 Tax=Brevibacillus fluminis TaxID=511487 RepID=UPI003F8C29A1
MLAVMEQTENGYIARFERHLPHPVEQVWAMLTENDKLAQWFSELRVDALRVGGVIKFGMPDGTFLDMEILDLTPNSVLAYTWGEDRVRFELQKEHAGCRLTLIETIHQPTPHTPKDLAGWHVCLDVIGALLAGKTIESRKSEWEKVYPRYSELIDTLTQN